MFVFSDNHRRTGPGTLRRILRRNLRGTGRESKTCIYSVVTVFGERKFYVYFG